ncbi:PASTA domain-containing protein [Saccharicrinis aurantiacus]|uniref:PASTA domain-containing protein n=1 Tax=Saccharicrinis aurantiacus TaxID=1849719 RepID=UPI0024907448|nr:PASTA domain-containing protein [Saccharicrinis aurantiacus]
MAFLKFLISKRFLLHAAAAIGLIVLLLISTFIGLSIYTHHRESKATPDFTGLKENQLIDLVQSNNLRYKIIDSVHINGKTPGVVVDQTPNAGALVKEDRTIFFTINAYSSEQVPMPRLIDASLRNAEATLESYGLKIGELIYIPSEYSQLILGQHYKGKPIEPGTLLSKGSEIDLLIGKGLSNKKTNIPELIGLGFEEANSICQSNMLSIGASVYDKSIETEEDSLSAFIWKQSPQNNELSNRKVRLGSSINIWLTNDSTKVEAFRIELEEAIEEAEQDQQQ